MDLVSNAALEGGAARDRRRIPVVDLARGAAVAAMVVYHGAWDLSELRLITAEVTIEPGWRFFARAIASSFLLLVGVGLVLAHRDGIRWPAFLRRLGVVAGAAVIVTVATAFAFPDSYIFFGILHAIAVSSVLALPFLTRPAFLAAAAAVPVFLAPLFLTGAVFDAPVLAFLGLGSRVPSTNDWVPIFPWSGFVLAGIAIGKLARPVLEKARRVSSPRAPMRALAWAGRHSLVIYLLHQPLLFGAASALVRLTGPNPAALAAPFLRSCIASCRETAAPETICRATCDCTMTEFKTSAGWPDLLGGRATPDQQRQIGVLARSCFARSQP